MAAPSPKQDPSIPKFDQQTLYIAGQRYSTQETFQTIDPATDKPIADVSKADRHSIDAAVRAGQAAFPTWSATPAIERASFHAGSASPAASLEGSGYVGSKLAGSAGCAAQLTFVG